MIQKYRKVCWECGKEFNMRVDENGKILTNCYYTTFYSALMGFDWWEYERNKKGKMKPIFKRKIYKLIGFNSFMRKIIYKLYLKFSKGKSFEYIECPSCYRKYRTWGD